MTEEELRSIIDQALTEAYDNGDREALVDDIMAAVQAFNNGRQP